MLNVERDLDRVLNRLRNAIRERGFTQLEVQETLGWGRSYISQILTKQKTLRIEQVLMILNVIDVKPEVFWDEIYLFSERGAGRRARRRGARRRVAAPPSFPDGDGVDNGLRRIRLLYDGIVSVLTQKHLIDATDLEAAIERAKRQT